MSIATFSSKLKGLALLAVIVASVSLLFGVARPVLADQSSSTIAQGFQADSDNGDIVAGAIVSVKSNNPYAVDLATTDSLGRLAGVVDKNPLVAISSAGKNVEVVLSGTTNVLVSDINGTVHTGDKITASPIAGIGMLATADSQVIGTAQGNLQSTTSTTVTDRKGIKHTVHIGQIPLQVGIAYYQAPGSNFLPPFIQSIANSVAGRQVSLIRVLFCIVILLLAFVSIGILIYTSVRTAITSLGRNPLAAKAIRKGLYQVIVVAIVVLGGALLASYLILNV
ncbi:MAG TPA: hypothetical protein VLG11_03570 [Candidatus Saccharimonadales bacterium]|nr:hypothetical protein [Candidatus Saccharimonadales bacterium]